MALASIVQRIAVFARPLLAIVAVLSFTSRGISAPRACSTLFSSDLTDNVMPAAASNLNAFEEQLQQIVLQKIRTRQTKIKLLIQDATAKDLPLVSEALRWTAVNIRGIRIEVVIYSGRVEDLLEMSHALTLDANDVGIRYRFESATFTTWHDRRRAQVERPDLVLRFGPIH